GKRVASTKFGSRGATTVVPARFRNSVSWARDDQLIELQGVTCSWVYFVNKRNALLRPRAQEEGCMFGGDFLGQPYCCTTLFFEAGKTRLAQLRVCHVLRNFISCISIDLLACDGRLDGKGELIYGVSCVHCAG
ncbi:unnamed protein product, partial [Hapterophycus canaliculatus]